MMQQEIVSEHWQDESGKPAGGWSMGTGIRIEWQNGPLAVNGERLEPTGAFVEGVIQAAVQRIEYYETTEFANGHNAAALSFLYRALSALEDRTAERTARGVEGTHEQ